MNPNYITLFSLAGLALSGVGCISINAFPWIRYKLIGLSLFYLGGSLMLLNVCSPQMCAAFFACGVGSTVLLGTGHIAVHAKAPSDEDLIRTSLFRLLLAVVLCILAYMVTLRVRLWIPVRGSVLFVVFSTFMMDLISLSMDDNLLFRCVYLQGICLAFSLCYIYMENSVLVFACFTAINLLMSFGCSLLVSTGSPEPAADKESES